MKRLLFVGDSPDVPSGLSRITTALAKRVHEGGLAHVGYAGYWGIGTRHLPFPQYVLGHFNHTAPIEPLLRAIEDFSPDVVMTVYDVPRLWEISQAQRAWEMWGYFPVDAEGIHPGGALTPDQKVILERFDRVLAYGPFGARVLGATLGREVGWLPHAIEDNWGFREGGRDLLKRGDLRVTPEHKLLGVVGTNQPRKDWGTAIAALGELGPPWMMWGHIDKPMGVWNLQALADAYGVRDRIFLTNSLDDISLQRLYSACDVTFALGLGEGFGFPIVESLACGTPVAHVLYAEGANLIPQEGLIQPVAMRVEGAYCLRRPVLSSHAVASVLRTLAARPRISPSEVEAYRWRKVWPEWRKWFQRGLR